MPTVVPAVAMAVAENNMSFKKFIIENGFPILNVFDNDMETIFGHKKKDFVKGTLPDEPETEKSKEKKTKRKLLSYLRYAKVINEGDFQ